MINKIKRKNFRLKNHDYCANGAYFITICTNFKKNYIDIDRKKIIEHHLRAIETRFKGVHLDFYSIMPNHIHYIILLENSTSAIPRIVQAFKSVTTLALKKNGFNEIAFWQRNYYEHVVRNEKALSKIREYIINNPMALELKINELYE